MKKKKKWIKTQWKKLHRTKKKKSKRINTQHNYFL